MKTLCMLIFLALASNVWIKVSSDRQPNFMTIEDLKDINDKTAVYETKVLGNNMTALQKHVSFFDRNQDGIIYPKETFQGFRAMGTSFALSTAAAALIHADLSQKTRPGKPRSLELPIEVQNIKLGKHGSDSGAYDNEGMFVESKFEEIFSKYAVTHKTALTEAELGAMLTGNKAPKDTAGSIAASTEWKMLYRMCKDKDGLLQKPIVRATYDGTLFYQLEKNHSLK